MDKQMKLTDEQSEGIKKRLSYIKENNLFDVYLIDDMQSLLSSEQAWKEEIERLEKSKVLHDWKSGQRNLILSTENEQLRTQLNQAVEVLKITKTGINNGREFGYLKETSEKDLERMITRIDNCLASLSQGTEDKP